MAENEFDDVFEAAAQAYGVDPDVLKGIAYAESRFRPDIIQGKVKSPKGAIGMMQFMPETAKEYGINPLDPIESITGAAAYLRKSLDRFNGDYSRAIASYNWGPNRKAYERDDWVTTAPSETQNYILNVLDYADKRKSSRPQPKAEQPKEPEDKGTLGNIGSLLYEGGQRAVGAAKVAPSVVSGDVSKEQAGLIAGELQRKPTVQPKELTEVTQAFEGVGKEFEEAEGFSESIKPVLGMIGVLGQQAITNPKGALYLTAQSAANMVPAIVGMLGGAKAGAVFGPKGAVIGGIGGAFVGQAPLEVGMEFTALVGKELANRGLEVNEQNVARLLEDKKFVEQAVSQARKKGATTAAIDAAFTMGAGRFASAPGRKAVEQASKELGEKATGKQIAQRADELLKDRTFMEKVGRGAGAVGIDVAGGGISEAGGQLAAYGEVDLADVGLEMLGELGGSAIEVPAAARALRDTRRDDRGEPEAPPSTKPEAPVTPETEARKPKDPLILTEPKVITEEDIKAVAGGIPALNLPGVRRDILGRTREDLQALVDEDPEILENESAYARIIRALLEPAGQPDQLGVEPPVSDVGAAGLPDAAGAVEPDGSRVADTVTDVGAPAVSETAPAPAITPEVTETPSGITTPEALEAETQRPQEPIDTTPVIEEEAIPESFSEAWKGMNPEARLAMAQRAGIGARDAKKFSTRGWFSLPNTAKEKLEQTIQAAPAMERTELPPIAAMDEELIEYQRMIEEAEKAGKKDLRGLRGSLRGVLKGKLPRSEVTDISPDKSLKGLIAPKGKKPTPLSTLVADGALNDFLPFGLRTTAPTFDEMDAVGYIYDKLASGNFGTYEADLIMERSTRQIRDIEDAMRQHLDMEETNRLIQEITDEQRRIDAEAEADALVDEEAVTPEAQEVSGEPEAEALSVEEEAIRKREEIIRRTEELNERQRKAQEEQKRLDEEALKLTPPTPEAQAEAERRAAEAEKAEQEAAKEADKAKAAETRERERKEIAERSKGASEDFQLGQTAEQNLTGQKDILFSTDSQISTNEEKQEALAQFRDALSVKAPTFKHRGGSGAGRIITTRPRKLTKAQVDEIIGLASDAVDLGMPASLFRGITAGGTTNEDSSAAIVQPEGFLLLNSRWAGMTRSKKLQILIHEIGHQADYQNSEAPKFSGEAKWEQAYEELKNWYDSDVKERKKTAPNDPLRFHPLAYPFAPGFRGAVRLRQEAFAQAFAYYFTNPVLLQTKAPIAYGQIQSILEGIQNESQPTSRTSEAARKAAEGKVQPAGAEGAAGVRPQDAEVVSGGRPTADGGQRGAAPVKGEKKSKAEKEAEQEAIDKQEANIPSIWGGTIKPSFVVDNEINWFERYIMQPLVNRNYDVRNVYNSIRKAAIEIPKRFDIKELEITSSGMEGEMERQFVQEEVLPIQREMIAKNIESEDIHNYMLALHAKERNLEVARRNPKYPDGGSGMTNQEAQDYLDALSPERRKDLQAIKEKLDAIQDATRDLIVQTGQEKASTVAAWTSKFKNYVPLFREEMEYDDNISPGQGTGISVRGDFSRSFTGSSKPVQDVFASIVAQRQRAIARGMKMRQGRGLFGLALTAPAPNFWMAVDPRSTKMEQLKRYQEELAMIRGELAGGVADPVRQEKLEDRVEILEKRIEKLKPQAEADLKNLIDGLVDFGLSGEEISNLMAQPFEAVYSPTSGMVEYKPNRLLKSPYVVATRINGEEVYVFFNKNNERARRMAEQLHNMGTEPMDIFNRMLAPITRYFAAINTQYNPIWGAYNFLRDSQGAAIQASGTIIEDSRGKVVYDGFRMMLPIAKMLRDERKGKVSNSEVAVAFRELREQGGTTGFKDNFSRQEDRLKALTDQMKQVREGKLKSIVRNDVFGLVSDFNTSLENTIRLSAYMEAKRKYTEQYMKEGLSREAAEIRAKQPSAVVAKNITVNFNQKGGLSTKIGSLFAFFNAAVQGTVRAAETLFTWDKPGDFKSIRPTPFGKKFIGGALLWGVMQPVLLSMFGIDPDDLEEYQKERNFIIPLGDGKMFFFPMPFVFSAIPNTSRIMTEWYMGGMKDAGKYVTNLGGAYLNAFNPLGGSLAVQTFTPTPFKPIIALANNEDAFGRKIAREPFNESQQIPGYQLAKDSASAFGKSIAEFMNFVTGGTKDVAGAISPTPDEVDYFVGQLTGGLGREVLKASQIIESPFTGEKVPFYKYPLVGRFGADVNEGGAIAGKFYNNLTKINAYENTIKGMTERRENVGQYLRDNPQARLYKQANIVEREIQKLRRTMREAKERGQKDRVKSIQEQIENRMRLFNQRVEAADK